MDATNLLIYSVIIGIPAIATYVWYSGYRKNKNLIARANVFPPPRIDIPNLPFTIKGVSLIPGGNDLHLNTNGFAFTSVGHINDVIYWADVSGFTLSISRYGPVVMWRMTNEFRGKSIHSLGSIRAGISQRVFCKKFSEPPERIVHIMNQIWLDRRDKAIT